MFDLHAGLCALPVELKELILSKIEHIEAHHVLALSSTFQEAFSLLRALPRTFYFGLEGVESVLADHLVRVLDDDRVRSLGKERALELMGEGNKDRLCQYACGRNFEVLKWAHNELDRLNELERALDRRTSPLCVDTPRELPWHTLCIYTGRWEPYRGRVSDDFLVLRVLRETWPQLKRYWPLDVGPEEWGGVTLENGRVVKLELEGHVGNFSYPSVLTGALPAEVGRLSALRKLQLSHNKLTSLPAQIGQLTSLERLNLFGNQLTSLPAEIGQLTSLTQLYLYNNQLTSLPTEIGRLTSLKELWLDDNQLTSWPVAIRELKAAGCRVEWDRITA